MKVIKILGASVAAWVIALMCMGTSAMANGSTSLCKVNETPCAAQNQISSLHLVAKTIVLKSNILTILCLGSLMQVPISTTLGNPLKTGALTSLTWENCGSNAAHNNCTITNLKLPSLDFLRFAPNLAEVTVLNMELLKLCGEAIHCVYGGAEVRGLIFEGALHTASTGHGMLTANEVELPKVSGFLCPSTHLWTVLYEPLEHVWVST